MQALDQLIGQTIWHQWEKVVMGISFLHICQEEDPTSSCNCCGGGLATNIGDGNGDTWANSLVHLAEHFDPDEMSDSGH